MSAKLYGTAVPGELVNATTDIGSPWMATLTAADGTWAMTYNLPPGSSWTASFALTVTGSVSLQPLVFTGVRWGDVYVCLGDSSVLLPVDLAINGSAWLAGSRVQSLLNAGSLQLWAGAAVMAETPQPDASAGPCTWPGHEGVLPCNAWVPATNASASAFSALCLQSVVAIMTSGGGNPGNVVAGVIQLAANVTTVSALLPPGANTSACGTWIDPSPPPLPPSSLWNGMVAPLARQTWRALLLSTAGSDAAAAQASTAGAYACYLASLLEAMRMVPVVGDYPVLLPLAPAAALPIGITGDVAFRFFMEQAAVLPHSGGKATTVAGVPTSDIGQEGLSPTAGAPNAPLNTLPVASRLALGLSYTGFWDFSTSVASGPIPLSAVPSHAGTPAVQVASGADGPWFNTALALQDGQGAGMGGSGLKVQAVPSGPSQPSFVRYGAAPPSSPECFLVDTLSGLPALPFMMDISTSTPFRATARQATRSISPTPTSSISSFYVSSSHLVQQDGSFDRAEYMLHGRARAQAVAAARASGVNVGTGILSPTPPMGWNSWQAFRCNMDELLLLRVGDALVSSGLASAGYSFVGMDDCIMRSRLAGNSSLTEDETRFPSTLFALGQALARKGLGFGVYTSATSETCVGRPASYEHEDVDTDRWCEWGFTYVKVDNCGGSKYPAINTSWINIRAGLDAHCGARGVVLSVETCGDPRPSSCGGWIRASGAQLWRTTGDLQLYWQSVLDNLDGNEAMAPLAGPGGYNDPDMLIVGHAGLTEVEAASHVGGWAISAAPLLLSFDVSNPALLTARTLALLSNPEMIAIDQDEAGVQGVRVTPANATGAECWARPLAGSGGKNGGNATAVFLINRSSIVSDVTCSWTAISPGVLTPTSPASVRDVWARSDLGTFTGSYTAVGLPSHGSALITVIPVPSSNGNGYY